MRFLLPAVIVLAALAMAAAAEPQQQQENGGRVVRKMVRKRKMMPAGGVAYNGGVAPRGGVAPEQPRARGGRPVKVRRKRPFMQPQQNRDLFSGPVPNPDGPSTNEIPESSDGQQQQQQQQRRRFKVRRRKVIPGLNNKFVPAPSVAATPAMDRIAQVNADDDILNVNNRTEDEKRFLSLFTIVSFQNDPCTSGSGNNGTCYSSSDCSNLGGTASGSCASGFGVCCLFTKTCGESTSNNCTYFQNAGYPSTFDTVGSCQLTVNKINSNVCQLRLDFENLILAQPEAIDHICQNDQFIVSGGAPIPSICGTNTGIHMYVDVGLSSTQSAVLSAVTSGSSFSRSFSVKVTQVECTSLSRASDGCLQYFTGVSGQILSFNYNSGSGLQLSNTDYSACVRMERNFCGIQYSACTDTVNTPAMSFSVTGGNPTLGSVVGSVACTTDWVTIPCATNTNDPNAQTGSPTTCVDRICGMVFNSVTTNAGMPNVPVNSFMKPFTLFVHTDSLEGTSATPESANRGFCLNYVQQPCSTSTG